MLELLTASASTLVIALLLASGADHPLTAGACLGFAALAVGACFRTRRVAPRGLGLAAAGFVILFILNYPLQYLLAGLMYESAEWSPLLRSFSIRPINADWSEQLPVLAEIALTLGVLATGLTSLMLASVRWRGRSAVAETVSRSGTAVLLAGALAVAAAGIPLQFFFDIGSLTAASSSGYRLDGVLYHALVTAVPIALLAIHAAAVRSGWKGIARVSLAAFVTLALAETAMMSSRGYVILQMTMVVLVYVWDSSMRWRAAAGIVAATLAGALILYPLVTSVRILRSNLGFTPLESFSLAWDALQNDDHQKTLLLLVSRFVGYTSYLVSVQHAGERFDWSRVEAGQVAGLRESSFTRWYTETAAGYGVGVRGHFSSPGVMGAGFVIGGRWLAWSLPAIFALLAALSVQLMARWSGPVGAIAPAVWLGNLLFVFNEGTLDLGFTKMILTMAGLGVVAFAFRTTASLPARGGVR